MRQLVCPLLNHSTPPQYWGVPASPGAWEAILLGAGRTLEGGPEPNRQRLGIKDARGLGWRCQGMSGVHWGSPSSSQCCSALPGP